MKKIYLAFLTVAMIASGCSDDESPVPQSSESAHEISFYATAPKGSRAASVTTSTLKNFKVYAFTESSVVMNGVTVTKEGGLWTYSPQVYWPASPVDFYAISPAVMREGTTFSSAENMIQGVEYGNTDILYAVSLNQIESPAPVPLTFRHAMSNVAVMLSSTSNKYIIEVYHVSLNNISLTGNFQLPEANTSDEGVTGTWQGLSAPASALVYYDIDGVPTLLTTTPRNLTEGNLDVSFFVPQPLEPLQYSQTGGFSGCYMQIDCIVKDKDTGAKVWPNENTPSYLLVAQTECGRMLFPLSTDVVTSWQQGYSYIYNVVINSTYSIDTIEFAPVVKDYVETKMY